MPTLPPSKLPAHLWRYKNRGVWIGRTVAEEARALAERAPDRPLFIGGDAPYTAAQLLSDAEALAVGMSELGVRPGSIVSMQLPNWTEAATINVATAMLGGVVMPIVPIYRDAEVAQMLRDSGSHLHFTAETFRKFDYAAMLTRLRQGLPDLDHVVFLRGDLSARSYSALLDANRGKRPVLPRVDACSVKLLLYTSGTTGRAKGVLHSHDTLTRCLLASTKHWSIDSGDVILMPSPFTHVTGYAMGLELPFVAGTRTLPMQIWDAQEAAALIDQHGVVGMLSATPFLQELTDAAERLGTRLPTLRFFACGGAPVPQGLVRRANAVFAQVCAFRVYGASEVPMITQGYLGENNAELAATTDGEIIDYEVRIVDDDGYDVPPGQQGEILARGATMFMGYVDSAQTEAAITNEGYFRTGDLGMITPQGALIVTGRKKDLIIRGGENISPKEIEDVLHQHPGVLESAVISMPHARLGEGICAYIVAKSGHDIDMSVITAHLAANGLARQKYPEKIIVVPGLPKTASGKVRKDILRAQVRSQDPPT